MGLAEKRAAWGVALGLLGLVSLPVGAHAANPHGYDFNTSILVNPSESDSGAELDFVITPGNLIPTFASVTAPKISGVDLFSNQAVFLLSDAGYLENMPISSAHANSDEVGFWESTVIGSGGSVTIGAPSAAQFLLGTSGNTAETSGFAARFDSGRLTFATDSASSTAAPFIASGNSTVATTLGVPTLSEGSLGSGGRNIIATAAGNANFVAPNASSLADPILSRDLVLAASPTVAGELSPVPEPASIALLGIFTAGLLARRRTAR